MKVGVIGAGYVGLVQACAMAQGGHEVFVVDTDKTKVEKLRRQEPTFHEKDLEGHLADQKSRMTFDTSVDILKGCEVIFVAVGTPQGPGGQCDTRYVHQAVEDVIDMVQGLEELEPLKDDILLVVKSTVPVGTNKIIRERVKEAGVSIRAFSSPEFLREGTAFHDTYYPDRTLVGGDLVSDVHTKGGRNAFRVLFELYESFSKVYEDTFFSVTAETAEMVKYASNSFLATKISFFNMIAMGCQMNGADALDVIEIATRDNRIGEKFSNPGIGFGGACFPKDVAALHHDIGGTLLDEVLGINNMLPGEFTKIVREEGRRIDKKHSKMTLIVLGASFKAGTSDCRESPALNVIRSLAQTYGSITVYDPNIDEVKPALKGMHGVMVTDNVEDLTFCDMLINLTERDLMEFDDLVSEARVVIDGRPTQRNRMICRAHDIRYTGIGLNDRKI